MEGEEGEEKERRAREAAGVNLSHVVQNRRN